MMSVSRSVAERGVGDVPATAGRKPYRRSVRVRLRGGSVDGSGPAGVDRCQAVRPPGFRRRRSRRRRRRRCRPRSLPTAAGWHDGNRPVGRIHEGLGPFAGPAPVRLIWPLPAITTATPAVDSPSRTRPTVGDTARPPARHPADRNRPPSPVRPATLLDSGPNLRGSDTYRIFFFGFSDRRRHRPADTPSRGHDREASYSGRTYRPGRSVTARRRGPTVVWVAIHGRHGEGRSDRESVRGPNAETSGPEVSIKRTCS
jgi:hypothetical protein